MYSDPNTTKTMLEEDDTVMTNFFGSPANGREIMSELSEDNWQNMD